MLGPLDGEGHLLKGQGGPRAYGRDARGRARSSLAAAYPEPLCARIAHAAALVLGGQPTRPPPDAYPPPDAGALSGADTDDDMPTLADGSDSSDDDHTAAPPAGSDVEPDVDATPSDALGSPSHSSDREHDGAPRTPPRRGSPTAHRTPPSTGVAAGNHLTGAVGESGEEDSLSSVETRGFS